MKKTFETFARLFRWMVVGMISFVIALPTWISYTAEI